jgi:hypothetical protein
MSPLAQRLNEAIAARSRRRASGSIWAIHYVEISITDAHELLALITTPPKKEQPNALV